MATLTRKAQNFDEWHLIVFEVTEPSGAKRQVEVYTPTPETARMAVNCMSDENVEEMKVTGIDLLFRKASAGRSATGDDISDLYEAIHRCMDIGAPVDKALVQAMYTARTPYMRGLLCALYARVRAGSSLAAALGEFPESFDIATVALVAAGEEHGRLQEFLGDLADVTTRNLRLMRKCRAGLSYPGFLLAMALGVVLLMCFFMIPKMLENYKKMNVPLPLFTQILDRFATFIRHPATLIGAPILALISWKKVVQMFKSPQFKWLVIRLPVVGPLARNMILVRCLRILSIMLRSGVRQLEAYDTIRDLAGHPEYAAYFDAIRERVAAGESDAVAFMREARKIPKDGLKLGAYMKLAEFLGDPSVVLERIAGLLDEDTNTMAEELPKVVEPILLMFVGLIVGGIIAAVYLPGIYLMLGASQKANSGK